MESSSFLRLKFYGGKISAIVEILGLPRYRALVVIVVLNNFF
jgi:hypothetical protein